MTRIRFIERLLLRGSEGSRAATSAERALLFATALERACTRALGEAVAAVILHGSLTLADYVPGSSDVDLLAVVDRSLTDAQLAALTAAVSAEAGRAPGRVDLRVVTRQAAAAPTAAPPLEASIEIEPAREPRLQVRSRVPGERDLVVEFSMCRAHGRRLSGAAPTELIGEVPAGCGASPRSGATARRLRQANGRSGAIRRCR